MVPDIKLYFKAVVIKMAGTGIKIDTWVNLWLNNMFVPY